jgi:hypothetical protein
MAERIVIKPGTGWFDTKNCVLYTWDGYVWRRPCLRCGGGGYVCECDPHDLDNPANACGPCPDCTTR